MAATPGSVIWAKRYTPTSDDEAHAIAVSPDGSTVFVAGRSLPSSFDYQTIAYSASTGTQLWSRRYNGAGASYDEATAIAVSPDGTKVFVTGFSAGTSTGYDYATVAYNASSGNTIWTKRYTTAGNADDEAKAIGVSPNGAKVFVTGYGTFAASSQDYVTVAYDASNGAQSWSDRYNRANLVDAATTLDVGPDGRVFVSGASNDPQTQNNVLTVAYEPDTGARDWVKRFPQPSAANSLTVGANGATVFITGYQSTTSGQDYLTLAYKTSDGAKLWSKLYNGPGNSTDVANSVAVSPDSLSVFVTGYDSATSTASDYTTVAYSAGSGGKLWVKHYSGALDDEAQDIAVSPDGLKVIVTGYSQIGSFYDYLTIAYGASSGTQLWSKRYNSSSRITDKAFAVEVRPDGSAAYVTGLSNSPITGTDIETIAYALT